MAERSSGILLHPTSLPGPLGIGDLGPDAHRFAEVLHDMRQSWWQMLPVGPTGFGDSPYQSPSTFAGNPLLVSPLMLAAEGLVGSTAASGEDELAEGEVDYDRVIPARMALLARAAEQVGRRGHPLRPALEEHEARHGEAWLDDFSLYTALKRANRQRPWWEWDEELVRRDPDALRRAGEALAGEIRRVRVEQLLFEQHFSRLRQVCQAMGIGLIGDIPFFVAHDSADVWANQHLFSLDESGRPTVVAGVPPDYFSATGQRWGNPLYRWERHREEGFAWWTRRMQRMLSLFDLVRIDHFRGFAAAWEIPAASPTAVRGRWVEAPGAELFERLGEALGHLPVIAEDLGLITEDVEELRERLGFPGMRVLQFGMSRESPHAPAAIPEEVVAYTGTHDNDTTAGWWEADTPEREEERRFATEHLGLEGREIHWEMMRLVAESRARIVVFPLQDLLGLGSAARMNTPGSGSGNWRWRFTWEQLDPEVRERMRSLTEATGRAGPGGRRHGGDGSDRLEA